MKIEDRGQSQDEVRHAIEKQSRASIELVIVDQHSLLRAGVRRLIEAAADIEVVDEVETLDEAIEACQPNAPDVVLLNVDKADVTRVDDMQRLRREMPEGALVVLARHEDDEEVFRAVIGGAAGHVGDSADPEELLATIRAAAHGDEPIQQTLARRPLVARRVLETFAQLAHGEANAETDDRGELSGRERRILELAAEGKTNLEIGREMGVSEHTVKGAISHLLARLRLRHRTEAVVHALRLGWIAPPRTLPQRVVDRSIRSHRRRTR